MRKLRELITTSVLLALSTVASANIIYTWTADGMTESAGQQATAVFNFASADSFTLTLTNNVSPTEFVASELDGILFSFSSAPISIDLLAVSAPQVLDCTAPASSPCPTGLGPAPYGWGASVTGSDVKVGAGYSGGDFSFHPYGIINQNYNPGALGDPAYNPLLVGPVTYTFAMRGLGSVPEIDSATFLFGAVPDRIRGIDPPNGVPEPNSLALIGIAMLAFVWTSRRKRRKF